MEVSQSERGLYKQNSHKLWEKHIMSKCDDDASHYNPYNVIHRFILQRPEFTSRGDDPSNNPTTRVKECSSLNWAVPNHMHRVWDKPRHIPVQSETRNQTNDQTPTNSRALESDVGTS